MTLLLVAATLVAFSFLLRCGFTTWDDDWTIEHNANYRPPTVHSVLHYWTHPYMDLYVPVTYTTWGVLAALTQSRDGAGEIVFDPRVFHGFNIVLHMCAALVVFVLLRRLLKHDLGAWAGALLFALHPVQVEPVGWVSGMKDVLCGLLVFIAIWQYVVWVEAEGSGVGGQRSEEEEGAPLVDPRWAHYGLGMFVFLLAMLSKPTAMVTPAIAAVLDCFVMRRSVRKVAKGLWPWLVLSAACMVWTKMVQPAGWADTVPMWKRPFIATDSLAFYLYKLVWPATLYFDYGRKPLWALEHGWPYWTWVAPAAAAAGVVWLWRRKWEGEGYSWRHVAGGALVLVIGVAPVLGLVKFDFQQISTVADHNLYTSMLGVALAAGAGVAWAVRRATEAAVSRAADAESAEWRRHAGVVAGGAVAVVALALGVRSAAQTRHWEGPSALNEHELRNNPRSYSAYQNLGLQFSREGFLASTRAEWALLHGNKDEAAALQTEAAEKFNTSEQLFAKVIAIESIYVYAYYCRGEVLGMLKRFDEAEKSFDAALRLRPMCGVDARKGLTNGYMLRGLALMELNRPKEAAVCFKTMLREEPGFEPAAKALALAEEKVKAPAKQIEAAGAETGPAVGK